MLIRGYGRAEFALPERGPLLAQLRALAFSMQRDGGEVSFDYDRTVAVLGDGEHADAVLDAAVALNLLDKTDDHQIKFFHQRLQEYFAARQFARAPDPALVSADWQAATYAAEIAALPPGVALPALEQSHWVETAVIAVPMANDPAALVRALMPVNLPLAARCAQSGEWHADEHLSSELRAALVKLSQHWQADVRVRIAASEQLSGLGDPRFTQHAGSYGRYITPRFRGIAGGTYPIGTDGSGQHHHSIAVAPFDMAEFAVTNAEYALFIESGGYQQTQWWDTSAAKRWLIDDGGEGEKAMWANARRRLRDSWSDEDIRAAAPQRWSSKAAEWYVAFRNWTEDEFEKWASGTCTHGKLRTEPAYWGDPRHNNPLQPVVGVTWHEARAYANWLTANAADGRVFRLPSNAEFDAAARGQEGRLFPYGNTADVTRSNTRESRIHHTTPVGIFDNATPEGIYDLSGNVWTWTLSLSGASRRDDGHNDIEAEGERILRGGSWDDSYDVTRTSHRNAVHPSVGNNDFGFRLVRC